MITATVYRFADYQSRKSPRERWLEDMLAWVIRQNELERKYP